MSRQHQLKESKTNKTFFDIKKKYKLSIEKSHIIRVIRKKKKNDKTYTVGGGRTGYTKNDFLDNGLTSKKYVNTNKGNRQKSQGKMGSGNS